MSDEQLPPTHQPWGAKPVPPSSSQPPPAPPPSFQPSSGSPYQPPPNPYPQPGSFDQYAAPNPYAAYPAGYGGTVPDHPSATTALVLGIVGLVGVVVCLGIPLVLSPFAWVIGSRAVREIDASPGRYRGRENANAGRIMGIIGTVLLVVGAVAFFVIIALAVSIGSSDGGGGTPHPVIQHDVANS
jgi:hypothetical protein